MKTFVTVLIAFSAIITACQHSDKKKNSNDSATFTTSDADRSDDVFAQLDKKIKKGKNLKPFALDKLKAMLPDQVDGIKRSDFEVNSISGYSSANANYNSENKQISIEIVDWAGNGSLWFAEMYPLIFDQQSENEEGYTKPIEFNGGKAIERFEKELNETTLTYIAKDRLIVSISVTGDNVGVDEAKQVAKALSL